MKRLPIPGPVMRQVKSVFYLSNRYPEAYVVADGKYSGPR